MTAPRNVEGIIPVVHTPFLADDSIDWESLERELEWAQSLAIAGYCRPELATKPKGPVS